MSRASDCTNADGSAKRKYRSQERAEKLARRQNHDRPFEAPVHAYLCPESGRDEHWHVGHPIDGDRGVIEKP